MIADLWDDEIPDEEDDDDFREMRAPFIRQFPGLAPAQHKELSAQELDQALDGIGPARIGLASADRPADVLPLIGWDPGNWPVLPVAAVLRSWEDRFGATLLQIGFAEIQVLLTRPPRTLEVAQLLAAEQFAYCDECAGRGLHDVSSITEELMKTPICTFWWD